MLHYFKRPYSNIVVCVFCFFLSSIFVYYCSLISLSNSWTYYLIFSLFLIMFLVYLSNYNISLLFTLTKENKKLTLCMRTYPFIKVVKSTKGDSNIVMIKFYKDFVKAAKSASTQFPNEIICTKTWLLNPSLIAKLRDKGFKIEDIDYNFVRRLMIGFTAFLAYRNWDEWKDIKEAQFYKLSWTKEELEKIKSYQ